MDKRTELLALAKLRQATRWPGYKCIGEYHGGAYECDFVSPYTKTAGNVDAEIMVMLQDWASDGFLIGRLHEPSVKLGHSPSLPTNRNLIRLLKTTFGLTLTDVYGTNLFPFVKPGEMTGDIPERDMVPAARQFALPQIRIVNPKLVICLGLATFNALRQVCGLSKIYPFELAIKSPFNIGPTRVWCQAHTGVWGRNTRNKGGVDRVSQDWLRMKADFAVTAAKGSLRGEEQGSTQATRSDTGRKAIRVVGRTVRLTGREKRMNTNTKMSRGLEYERSKGSGDQGNSFYLAGAPWGCSGAKGGIGVASAFDGSHHNHPDFFYLTWIVKKQRNPPANWACRIIFEVASPIHDVNGHLNDLKLEVIKAFQNSNVCSVLAGKGYPSSTRFTRTSPYDIRWNKNTTVFTVVLEASPSQDTSDASIRANITSVHDAVEDQVEAVLKKLKLANRLEKYFGW